MTVEIKLDIGGSGHSGWRKAQDQDLDLYRRSADDIENEYVKVEKGGTSAPFENYKKLYGCPLDGRNVSVKPSKPNGNFILGPCVECVRDCVQKCAKQFLKENIEKYGLLFSKIKKIKERNKIIISLYRAGPSGDFAGVKDGCRDSGKYSIDNTIKLCSQFIPALIGEIRQSIKSAGKILIRIKGHSRGGVAAGHIAKKLQEAGNMQDTEISLSLFDPVPGPGHTEEERTIDFKNEPSDQKTKPTIKSVWIVSSNSCHSVGFSPAKIKNSDIVILTNANHSLYLKDPGEGGHKLSWYYGQKQYSFGELCDLEDGYYYDDGKRNLSKIKDETDIKSLLSTLKLDFDHASSGETDYDRVRPIYEILHTITNELYYYVETTGYTGIITKIIFNIGLGNKNKKFQCHYLSTEKINKPHKGYRSIRQEK